MRIVIIDDEHAMHLIMSRIFAKMPEVDVVASFRETSSAFDYLMVNEVDAVFVDINMPRESGLELAKRLRDNGMEMKLVFVTSHKEYALSAFDVYAYDYIVKPVNQERLFKTIQRVLAETQSGIAVNEAKPLHKEVMFNLLGGIDIRNAQGEMVKWKSSKSTELFGYLLIHRSRRVSRMRIIEDIFGDMPSKNAEIYLNTSVYQLRKLLEINGLKGILHSDNSHYALNCNDIRLDFREFEEGCKQLAHIDNTNIEEAIELERLYVGDLFGDRSFLWARNEIERLLLIYNTFGHRLCSALLAKGETKEAIRLLKKLISHNELDELSLMSLMKALALLKNKEAITQEYLQFRENLNSELGISPSRAVTILYNQLLAELE